MRRRRPLPALFLGLAITVSAKSAASAEWYGYQTLATDGASIATGAVIVTAADGNSAVTNLGVGLGALGYGLGPPIVHLANDRPGAAVGSLGLRLGLPLVGAITGAFATKGSDNFIGVFVGAVVGAVVAIALDASLLAWKTEASPASPSKASGSLVTFAFPL